MSSWKSVTVKSNPWLSFDEGEQFVEIASEPREFTTRDGEERLCCTVRTPDGAEWTMGLSWGLRQAFAGLPGGVDVGSRMRIERKGAGKKTSWMVGAVSAEGWDTLVKSEGKDVPF